MIRSRELKQIMKSVEPEKRGEMNSQIKIHNLFPSLFRCFPHALFNRGFFVNLHKITSWMAADIKCA